MIIDRIHLHTRQSIHNVVGAEGGANINNDVVGSLKKNITETLTTKSKYNDLLTRLFFYLIIYIYS